MIVKPVGIDYPIQDMQELLTANLWAAVPLAKKAIYHRVFANRNKNNQLEPQVYIDSKSEYETVVFDDRKDFIVWFDVDSQTSAFNNSLAKQDVGVVVIVNLKNVYPLLAHRAVEEAHLDVQKIINKRQPAWDITQLITGVEAFGEFDISRLKYPDHHPWHVFRFNCSVTFNYLCK